MAGAGFWDLSFRTGLQPGACFQSYFCLCTYEVGFYLGANARTASINMLYLIRWVLKLVVVWFGGWIAWPAAGGGKGMMSEYNRWGRKSGTCTPSHIQQLRMQCCALHLLPIKWRFDMQSHNSRYTVRCGGHIAHARSKFQLRWNHMHQFTLLRGVYYTIMRAYIEYSSHGGAC